LVEVGGALQAGADPQQHRLVERTADQLDSDRKTISRKACRIASDGSPR